jgi:hypothetical protein
MHYIPLQVLPWLDFQFVQHQQFRREVQAVFPNRPPTDWWDDLRLCEVDELIAVALVYSTRLEELKIEPFSADPMCVLPLTYVTADNLNNPQAVNGKAGAPLSRLRLLEVGRTVGGSPLDSLQHGINLDDLPSLRELYFGFGTPFITSQHQTLTTLRLEHWACRTHANGELPLPIVIMAGGAPHPEAHRNLVRLLANLPNLQKLEMTKIRACDYLLTGYDYLDLSDELFHRLPSLPAAMRTHNTRLRAFKLTTKVYPAGANGNMWLYRGYFHHFSSWSTYQHLESLEMDSWFFFPGRPMPQPGIPVATAHPLVILTDLADSIQKVFIYNLVGDYAVQFYDFLHCVIREKQAGGLSELKEVGYTLLSASTAFPPLGAAMTLLQLERALLREGVVLD